VFPPPSTGLNQHETLSSLYLIIMQPTTLPVFDGQIIRRPVNELESRQYLGQLLLNSLKQRKDIVEARQSKDDIVRCLR
jgi:hypothetical protein